MKRLLEVLVDPACNKLSAARFSGLALIEAAIAFAFLHPDGHAIVAELLGAGLIALGLRKRAT